MAQAPSTTASPSTGLMTAAMALAATATAAAAALRQVAPSNERAARAAGSRGIDADRTAVRRVIGPTRRWYFSRDQA